MEMYKTVFVPSELVKSSMGLVFKINGDQLARDIQASISEQILNDDEVFSISTINDTIIVHIQVGQLSFSNWVNNESRLLY